MSDELGHEACVRDGALTAGARRVVGEVEGGRVGRNGERGGDVEEVRESLETAETDNIELRNIDGGIGGGERGGGGRGSGRV